VFENNPGIRYKTGTPSRAQSIETWSSGMPVTFGSASYANYQYSVYYSYSTGGTFLSGITGNTEVFDLTTTSANRRAQAVNMGESGELQSISIYHNGGTGNLLLGVYSDASGSPESLLGITPSTAINASEGWQAVSLSSPVSVTLGQTVWLAWVFENNPGIRYTTGTPSRAQSSDTWSSGMPAIFGSASYANYQYSIYCSFSAGETLLSGITGNTEVFDLTSTSPNRRAQGVTMGESGEIQSISIYHNGGTGNLLLGVYSDASGSPESLLGVTPSTAIKASEGWQAVSLSSPVSVTLGQTVWLAWVFEDNPGIRYTTGTPSRAQSSDTWYSGMPATFGSASYANYQYSIYCSFSVGETLSSGITGNTEVLSLTTNSSNRRAQAVTMGESGEIQSISIYHNGGTGNLLLGVYSDASGSPESLLGVTPSTAIDALEGWQAVSLSSPVSVAQGQTVWLAWVFDNNPGIRYSTTTLTPRAQSSDTWDSGMPATFGSASYANYKYSIYCTYTTTESIIKNATVPEVVNKNADLANLDEDFLNLPKINDFRIYPNPAITYVNIVYPILPQMKTKVFITDISGKIVINETIRSSLSRIELSQIPSGIYFVRVVNAYSEITKKLIITK
jgi:hypothetical protein